VAPGCARRKYPKEKALPLFQTNDREFITIDPHSQFGAPPYFPGAPGCARRKYPKEEG
jgi:hypothetical protein